MWSKCNHEKLFLEALCDGLQLVSFPSCCLFFSRATPSSLFLFIVGAHTHIARRPVTAFRGDRAYLWHLTKLTQRTYGGTCFAYRIFKRMIQDEMVYRTVLPHGNLVFIIRWFIGPRFRCSNDVIQLINFLFFFFCSCICVWSASRSNSLRAIRYTIRVKIDYVNRVPRCICMTMTNCVRLDIDMNVCSFHFA